MESGQKIWYSFTGAKCENGERKCMGVKQYDVAIVGAGPAGSFAAYELLAKKRAFDTSKSAKPHSGYIFLANYKYVYCIIA